eukprot:1191031-Prorocentrum_minimum.AAC.2
MCRPSCGGRCSKKRERMLGTGARSNAYTDFHHTVFHVHCPVKSADNKDLLPQVTNHSPSIGIRRILRPITAPQ